VLFLSAFKPFQAAAGTSPKARQTQADEFILADVSKASEVGERYAQALFDLAKDEGQIPAVEADLKAFKGLYAESKDLRTLIGSPVFAAEDKAKGLNAVAERAEFGQLTRKFIGFVAGQRRVAALPSIITSFEALSAAHRGVVAAQVTTAIALTPEQAKGLQSALRQALGKDPEIETRVDPSILGGLKVRVGSRLYDASLKSKLDSLKFALKRA
jgi:F-type H+-transporting ATPase subunit delta